MRILIAAALLVAGTALAAQPTPPPSQPSPGGNMGRVVPPIGMLFTGFDADDDARVSRDELRAGTSRAFAAADADRSGQVTLIELSTWSATWLGDASALPGRFDFDRDGSDSVSAEEFAAELARRFTAFDRDGDGVVIRGELLQSMPMRRGEGAPPMARRSRRR